MNRIALLGSALLGLGGCILLYNPDSYTIGEGGAGGAPSSSSRGGSTSSLPATSSTGGAGGSPDASSSSAGGGGGGCEEPATSSSSGSPCPCQRTDIATIGAARQATFLAVNGTKIFGAATRGSAPDGEIWSAILPGIGEPVTEIIANVNPLGLVVTDQFIYWTDDLKSPGGFQGVMRAPVSTMSAPGTPLFELEAKPGALTMYGGTLFFSVLGSPPSIRRESIVCGKNASAQWTTVNGPALLLAADENDLYYYNGIAIRRISLIGAAATDTAFALTGTQVHGLAVDTNLEGWVYWTRGTMDGTGTVARRAKPLNPVAGTLQEMTELTDLVEPRAIIADDTAAYWAQYDQEACDQAQATIYRLEVDEMAATPFISGLACPVALTADAYRLYWATGAEVESIGKH